MPDRPTPAHESSVQWIGRFHCAECEAVARTPSGLPSITWRKISGRWYCGTCATKRGLR